ncbi:MAG: GDSL-type esterase/lipase family protein [Clostridia bacterium]|nr:GDSL-type esterase/lipase family protein [Clostridia bacterium]
MPDKKWIQTWGQSHSALSLFCYPSMRKTYRLVMNTAIQGEKLRLWLSNTYGKNDVKIGEITAAPCDENGNFTGAYTYLTYGGKSSFTLKKGERVKSDEIVFPLKEEEYFCISIFVVSGDLNSGNLLDSAKLITVPGNYTVTPQITNQVRTRDYVITLAGKLLGMHFPKPIPLFDSVEVLNGTDAASIVVFGDSVSQQGFWTGPFEKRLRQEFGGKYSFVNKSVMGNRLLRDCSPIFPARGLYGNKATTRIKDDIYPYENISHVILFMGVNDVFEYATINAFPWEKPDTDEMCRTIKAITDDLHAKGIKVIMFNIPAFGAAPDATRAKDALRRKVNTWLEENQDIFDGFYDVASAAADPEDDYRSRAEFIGGDKLHPNAYGGEYLAGLVDLNMFR